MIEQVQVTQYRASDGSLWSTHAEAAAHDANLRAADRVREYVSSTGRLATREGTRLGNTLMAYEAWLAGREAA